MRPVRKIAPFGATIAALREQLAAGHVGTVVDFQRAISAQERTTRTAMRALVQSGEARHLRDTSYTTERAQRTLSAAVYGPAGAATDAPMTLSQPERTAAPAPLRMAYPAWMGGAAL